MTIEQLTIDPRGVWSPVQARRVIAILNPQAEKHGLMFLPHDVTTRQHSGTRLMLIAYCIEHEIAVVPDALCPMCVRPARRV